MLFTNVQHQTLFSEKLWDFAWVVHVYDLLLATAGRVEERVKISWLIAIMERGHLARFGPGGRDARAPGFADGV